MIKIVIIDFDDTLVDNIKADFMSFVIPCKKLGLKELKLEEIVEFRKEGLTANKIIQIILKKQTQEKLLEKFDDIREKFLFDSNSFRYLSLKDGVENFLTNLKQNGIKLILCSSRENKRKIINFLEKNDVLKYFTTILSMDDVSISFDNREYLKRLFIKNILLKKILRLEEINSEDVLYIGNAEEDYIAAKNMKIHFIYLQNYYLKDENFSNTSKINNMNEAIEKYQEISRVKTNEKI